MPQHEDELEQSAFTDGFIRRGVVGGQTGQRDSWFLALAAGARGLLLSRTDDQRLDRVMRFSCQGAIGTFQITSFNQRGLNVVQNVPIGPFGIVTIRTRGVVDVGVQNDSAAASGTFGVMVMGDSTDSLIEPVPQNSGEVTGLVQGAGGSPGTWTNVVVAPALSGWQPGDRPEVTLLTNGGLDYRFVSETTAQRSFFTVAGVGVTLHPPQYRLQTRHPGGAPDTRTMIATYRKP